jgi:uncharacterized membrane protein
MSTRLKRNFKLLDALKRGKTKKQRTPLLNVGKDDLILAICEIVDNVLRGTVKLTTAEVGKLKKYKNGMRKMVDKKVPKIEKAKILNQSGGFLPIILAPVLAVLGSLLGEVIGKAIAK